MKKRLCVMGSMMLALGFVFTGCGDSSEKDVFPAAEEAARKAESDTASQTEETPADADSDTVDEPSREAELTVRFGQEGEPFILHLYDNDTAVAIARHVGTSDWNLPIYHYDDYDNWEVMQYYDIPDRYEIPSAPKEITEEKAGQVYYSEPNRIILFYQDAEVPAEYTPVGYFDSTEEFIDAVENNPVLEGWGNKIIRIGRE